MKKPQRKCEKPLKYCETSIAEQLRQLTRTYTEMQKARVRTENVKESKKPYLEYDAAKFNNLFDQQKAINIKLEETTKKGIGKLVKKHEWGEYLLNIRGMGDGIAGVLIGELCGDIYESIPKGSTKSEEKLPKPKLVSHGPRTFERTSDLWAYCGFAVVGGKAMKRTSGETASWNKYLKQALFQFGEKQVMLKGDYEHYYRERKAYEIANHPDLKPMHLNRRAIRYMIKRLLSDIKHDLIDQKQSVKNHTHYVKETK